MKREKETVEIFFAYHRQDRHLLHALQMHLKQLERVGAITCWHDGEIRAGEEWLKGVNDHFNTAQIILLLVSPDFMASPPTYISRIIEKHVAGEARVIPIILRVSVQT